MDDPRDHVRSTRSLYGDCSSDELGGDDMNKYEMERLTAKAEELKAVIDEIKILNAKMSAWCPDECKDCPMSGKCLADGVLDASYDFTIEELADYIDYSDTAEERKAQADAEEQEWWDAQTAWEEANRFAGIDPQWMNVRR